MNELNMTPISENDAQESYVYRNPVKGTVQKIYWNASQDHLKRYARIQNSVGDVVIESGDGEAIPFSGDLINKVVVKILALPKESYEASSIIPGEKYGKPCRILEPDFVGGVSLLKFASENKEDQGLMWLLYYIECCVENTLKNMGIYGGEFVQENAKITNLENGELEITVTDIACNTPHMVRLTEEKIYFYRYLLLGILYRSILRGWQYIENRHKKAQN